jgi:hypothetical protein
MAEDNQKQHSDNKSYQEAPASSANNSIHLNHVIDVWKKVIDVQQHFNDLALRIRNYALTLFTAIIGGIGLVEKDKIHVTVINITLPASFILSIIGLIVLTAFWYMDRFWYHNLLVGAVKQGTLIENKYINEFPEIGLSKSISNESPHRLFGHKVRSKHKFLIFYGLLAIPLILLAIFLFPYQNNIINSSKNSLTIIKTLDTIRTNTVSNSEVNSTKHTDSSVTIMNSIDQKK